MQDKQEQFQATKNFIIGGGGITIGMADFNAAIDTLLGVAQGFSILGGAYLVGYQILKTLRKKR